jgi:hypothetical protein
MTYYTAIIIIVWFALLVLSILVFENNRISKQTKIIMYLTYLVTAIAALAEWLGVQFNGNASIPAWLLKLVKLFDYILTPIAGGAIVLQLRTKSIWQKIIFGILGANILFQIISFFTGWMVVINDDHKYSHGPAYIAYAIIYSLIIIFVVIEFAVYGARFKKQNRISLYALLLFVATGILLQEVFGSEIRTAYISIAVGLSLMFIHYSEFSQLETDIRLREQIKLVSLDALTGISNRHAYIEALQKMNMKLAFERINAEFYKLNIGERLYINSVIHKTYIKVDELGTEAAAVTVIDMKENTSAPDEEIKYIYMKVEHSFIYMIKDKRIKDTNGNNLLLFIGTVNNLKEENKK